ncbi:MAG: redoxin domain-containing protein [Gemmatimonadaceae bacterium]
MTETAAHTPHIGDLAPDFTLVSTSGEMVTLSDFRGKKNVLIAFFPLAFTSTCTEEVCAFSEDFDEFIGKNVEVVPISVDSYATLREYKKKYDLKVEMLSDFKRVASRAYGVLHEEKYYSNRAYFLLDKAGLLRWAHVEHPAKMRRENAELFEQINRLGA